MTREDRSIVGRALIVCSSAIIAAAMLAAACANEPTPASHADRGAGKAAQTAWDAINALPPCEPSPSHRGKDYQVGGGPKPIASLDKVPWERLGPGDTVRVFYRPEPYPGKFSINAHGTAAAPVRICGVKGPNGERPIIEGKDATTRSSMSYGRDSASDTNQARGLIMIVARGEEYGVTQPEYIQIDGLKLEGAQPANHFTDKDGKQQTYGDFGACIWIEHGHYVTVADNEITDCSQAVFSRSQDGDATGRTMHLRIAGNEFSNNGVAGSNTIHTTYIQSVDVIYEFNHYGTMRDGAAGNAIKDRSVGAVIRYNRIESGAYAVDLVEAEDYPDYALSDPSYRATFVYGNQIVKNGPLAVHYGGDHPGSEDHYRKGTLYFYNNTVELRGEGRPGSAPSGAAYMFRVSTTDETLQVWNNIFVYDNSIEFKALRIRQEVASPHKTGGIVNLGVNWINQDGMDGDPYHAVPGELNGLPHLIRGTTRPIDANLVPIAGSKVIGAGEAGPDAARTHPVLFQLDQSFKPVARSAAGAGADLGAVQH